jgi:hypothetical protein
MCAKKATKEETSPESDELEEAAELLQRIEAAEAKCQQARTNADACKEEYKSAKAAYGERVEALRKLCRARSEDLPLLNSSDAGASDGRDGWKPRPIADLKLSAKLTQKIIDAGHLTIGALSKHIEEQGEWWPKNIKGLGEKGREKVLEAYVAFWADHPEYGANDNEGIEGEPEVASEEADEESSEGQAEEAA